MLCFAADESAVSHQQMDVSGLMAEAGLRPGFEVII